MVFDILVLTDACQLQPDRGTHVVKEGVTNQRSTHSHLSPATLALYLSLFERYTV